MRCLLIGGPMDGKWYESDGREFLVVCEEPSAEVRSFKPSSRGRATEELTIAQHAYQRLPFQEADGTKHLLYAHESMRGRGVMEKLLNGYKAAESRGLINLLGQPARIYAANFTGMNVTIHLDHEVREGCAQLRDRQDRLLGALVNIGGPR